MKVINKQSTISYIIQIRYTNETEAFSYIDELIFKCY